MLDRTTGTETLQRIEPALGTRTVDVDRELYAATAETLLARLRRIPDRVGSVILIGHNPGMQELALDLARPGPERHELAARYPTAALATLAFPGTAWRALDRGTADLVGFVRPRDLER